MRDRTASNGINRRQFVVAATTQAAGATFVAGAGGDRETRADQAAAKSPDADQRLDAQVRSKDAVLAEVGLRLHVVGNGCPDPTPEHYGSSFILEVGADYVMVDCGPATTYKMVRMGIPPRKVGHLFFTHHHFDHNVDFPCFALTPSRA
jgi:hypothetical protein